MKTQLSFATCLLVLSTTFAAQAGKGLDATRISLPKGPGSIEGLGRNFSSSLASGTSSYGVDLQLPPGVAGFEPKLSLDYDSGGGTSDLGVGWDLAGLPEIRRRTENGLPRFDESDAFEVKGLGPMCDLLEVAPGIFRPQYESGAFIRAQRSADGASWEVRNKAGMTFRFGGGSSFVEADGSKVATYLLREQRDLHGHVISYEWDTSEGHGRLLRVTYNDFSPSARNEVLFTYEDRPDPHTRFSTGIRETFSKRLVAVETRHGGQRVRRWTLSYALGKRSHLTSVKMAGTDDTVFLPPLTLAYTEPKLALDAGGLVTMLTPPGRSPADPNVDLTDLDGDGLPDLLITKAGAFRSYLNHDGVSWKPGIDWPIESSPSVELASLGVQLADVDGDGAADLVVKSGASSFRYFPQKDATVGFGAAVSIGKVPSFSFEDPDVKLADMDGDRRADAVITTEAGLAISYNKGGTDWADPVFIGKVDDKQPLRFSDGKTQLCDVNGDRVQDLCYLRSGSLTYWLGRGRGKFEAPKTATGVPEFDPTAPFQLTDVDGDGFPDLLRIGVTHLEVALAETEGAFSPIKSIAGAPEKGPTGTVKLADMNASGTTDIVWVDVSGAAAGSWKYLELFPEGRAGLLTTIDNGLGKRVTITYGTAGREAAAARDAGKPWTSRINVGMPVVKKVAIDSGLGDPTLTTLFHYRDGTYSAVERTFAGFAGGTEVAVGDAFTPSLLTESVFDVGLDDRTQRGQVLSVLRKDESGKIFDKVTSTYTLKSLATALDGRKISYSFKSAEELLVVEGKNPSGGKTTLTEWEQDEYGNVVGEKRWGLVVGGDKLAGNDEALTRRTFANNTTDWILGHLATEEVTDAAGTRVRLRRHYYDGEAFKGLPLGEVVRGDLIREEAWVAGDAWELLGSSKYDADGNLLEMLDARGGGRIFKWDPDTRTFPIAEGVRTSPGKLLIQQAAYDTTLGTVKSFTNFNGAVSSFGYDGLGRITTMVKPGDSPEKPTIRYGYEFGAPLSKVTTSARIFSGYEQTEDGVAFTDGLGRKRGAVTPAAGGRYVLAPVTLFDARGNARRTLRARFVDASALVTPPLFGEFPGDDSFFDATGRLVRSRTQLGFESRMEYLPFVTKSWDPNQNDPSSPFEHTPVVEQHDGLGRLAAIARTLGGKDLVATYAYDPTGALLLRKDPEGHTARYQYDGKGRRVRVDDPDAGKHLFAFDTSDNLIAHTHPGGVVAKYTFDLADRPLTDDWNGDGTPEVSRTYDATDDGVGMLTSAASPAGLIALEYDARLRNTKTTLTLGGVPYTTGNAFDAQDRKYLHRYPDGSSIRVQYDLRGQIVGYGKDAVAFDLDADGREIARKFSTGVEEWHRYDGDRRRVESLARTKTGLLVQRLEWILDPVGNISEIRDNRPGITPDRDRSEVYQLDNLYRLTKVTGRWGETAWTYSASGNILERKSSDPKHHVGAMTYGASAGPHAVTGFKGRTISYDPRGRMLDDGDRLYTWNDADQLVSVTSRATGATATSAFDHAGMRRVRVEHDATGDHTTLFIDDWSEVKDGKIVRFIAHGGRRIARLADANGVAAAEPRAGCAVGRPTGEAPGGLMDPSRALIGLVVALVLVHRHWRALARLGRLTAPLAFLLGVAVLGTPGCGNSSSDAPPVEEGTILTLTDADELMFADAIGSATETTSGEGVSRGSSAVFPYGVTRYDSATEVTRKYANTPRDGGVGLDQMGARAYAPELGVWTSADPLAANDPTRMVGAELGNANAYAYAALRPTEFVDPTGAFGEWLKDKAAGVGNVLGGVAYGTLKAITPGGAYIPISPNDSAGFKYGEAVGQTVTGGIKIWAGSQLTAAGAGLAGLGGGATVASAGTASAVSVPATMAGVAVMGLGVGLMGSGVKDVALGTKTAVDTFQKKGGVGRSGKQAKLRELKEDPNLGSADRGWLKQEANAIKAGNRKKMRLPPGKDLAHVPGRESAKGYSYKHSVLQDRDLHQARHEIDKQGALNKERPLGPGETK